MKERENTIVALDINCMRPQTMEEEDITDMARRIENRGRLRIDGLINNTNRADETTPEMIEKGEKTVLRCAEILGVPTVVTAGKPEILRLCRLQTPILEMQRYMKPDWMEDP